MGLGGSTGGNCWDGRFCPRAGEETARDPASARRRGRKNPDRIREKDSRNKKDFGKCGLAEILFETSS
jgi:hypothetical protein